jgi:hypothetical protein
VISETGAPKEVSKVGPQGEMRLEAAISFKAFTLVLLRRVCEGQEDPHAQRNQLVP